MIEGMNLSFAAILRYGKQVSALGLEELLQVSVFSLDKKAP